jgi:hypothetical protein
MQTIRFNVNTNKELMHADFEIRDDAMEFENETVAVCFRPEFGYWSAHMDHIRVELIGYGVLKDEQEARSAVVWLATKGWSFPSSGEIDDAFASSERLRDIIHRKLDELAGGNASFAATVPPMPVT